MTDAQIGAAAATEIATDVLHHPAIVHGITVDVCAVVVSVGDVMSVSVHCPDDTETSSDLLQALDALLEALRSTRDRVEYLQR